MLFVFSESIKETYNQAGWPGVARLWGRIVIDLFKTLIHEHIQAKKGTISMNARKVISSNWAAIISLILCLPFLFVVITANFNYEPPFVSLLNAYLLSADGYTPTMLGRLVMLGMLLAVPVAFVINLLSMVTKAGAEPSAPFKLTSAHIIIGMVILGMVLVALADGVRHELRPFVSRLGSGSTLGQILFFLGLLALPMAFLLNLLPRFARAGSGVFRIFQPTSVNLIIGAAILLVILMIGGAILLEAIACSSGVPNCD